LNFTILLCALSDNAGIASVAPNKSERRESISYSP